MLGATTRSTPTGSRRATESRALSSRSQATRSSGATRRSFTTALPPPRGPSGARQRQSTAAVERVRSMTRNPRPADRRLQPLHLRLPALNLLGPRVEEDLVPVGVIHPGIANALVVQEPNLVGLQAPLLQLLRDPPHLTPPELRDVSRHVALEHHPDPGATAP